MLGANISITAGYHDGLMVAAQFGALRSGHLLFVGAEITAQIWAAKFVIKCGCSEWPIDHDIQSGHHALRFAMIDFPGLGKIWDTQIGYRKTAQSCLGFSTTTGSAFVTDFTTGAGCCTGKR